MKAIGIYEGTATAAEQQFEQLEIKKTYANRLRFIS